MQWRLKMKAQRYSPVWTSVPGVSAFLHKEVVDNVALAKHLHAFARIHHPLTGLHQRFVAFDCGILKRFSTRPLGVSPIGAPHPRVQTRAQASTLGVNLSSDICPGSFKSGFLALFHLKHIQDGVGNRLRHVRGFEVSKLRRPSVQLHAVRWRCTFQIDDCPRHTSCLHLHRRRVTLVVMRLRAASPDAGRHPIGAGSFSSDARG